jgi:transcriptional regulator with XRE-family HTH domain
MDPQDAFVTRLRRYRERNQISLDEISRSTRIKRELLDAFEQNDLSRWPRGLYARAWVRAYARAIGVDPSPTVDEFCRLFPHGDRRAAATIREMAAIIAHASEYRDEFGSSADRRQDSLDAQARAARDATWYSPSNLWGAALWGRIAAALKPEPRPQGTPRPS